MIEAFVTSGRIADLALVVLGLELAVLVVLTRRAGGRIRPLIFNAGAGAGLLLAFRAALTGAGALPILAALTLALVCHAAETLQRFRS